MIESPHKKRKNNFNDNHENNNLTTIITTRQRKNKNSNKTIINHVNSSSSAKYQKLLHPLITHDLNNLLGPEINLLTSSSPAITTTSTSSSAVSLSPLSLSIQQQSPQFILSRAVSNPYIDDDQWLTASVMNLLLNHIAKKYIDIHYCSEQFAAMKLTPEEFQSAEDIIGRKIYTKPSQQTSTSNNKKASSSSSMQKVIPPKSIVWIINNRNVHWCLLRAVFEPKKQLQYYDPLDTLYPCGNNKSWFDEAANAISQSHQQNSFDCGVACLLYAEKCGQNKSKEEINQETTQEEITEYRKFVQKFIQRSC